MKAPKGFAEIIDPSSSVWERDTVSCCHCGGIIFVKPGTACTVYQLQDEFGMWYDEDGAACYRCGMKPVCLPCHDKGTCTPLEKMLDELEGTRRKGKLIF